MTLDRELLVDALPAYEVGDELGHGAWGVVVAARHRHLGRDVAIKQLPRSFGEDPEVRARFFSEARLLAGLDHPHVVHVFDFVEHEGLCVIVMERLTGGTVWARHRTERFTPEGACAVALATSAGLHYAHEHGVLHRDVKPENLMFSGEGVLKVTDFGIAKVVGASQTMATRAGYVLGTPSYLAPEQARGHALSRATDVYAAGTVLYELLCGSLPYPDATDPVLAVYQHVHEDPRPLLDAAPHLPEALGEVTARSLARDPEDRFPTAAAFGIAIDDAATKEWGPTWAAQTGITLRGIDSLMARRAPQTSVTPTSATVPDVVGAAPTQDAAESRPEPPRAQRSLRPGRRAVIGIALFLAGVAGIGGLAWWRLGGGVSTGPAGVRVAEDLAVDARGDIYLADNRRNRVVRRAADGRIEVFAGTGEGGLSGDGGPPREAGLDSISSLAVGPGGDLYIASYDGQSPVRRVSNGRITSVPGTAAPQLTKGVSGVAVDPAGNLFLVSENSRRVFRVDTKGELTPVAGSGVEGSSGDGGPALAAQFKQPSGVAVDAKGNVYVADGPAHVVRRFTPGGSITTFAGTGTANGSGDSGPAAQAGLNFPYGVAVDGSGNVYIGDVGDARVRRVDGAGLISTVAGDGRNGFAGDGGPARRARLHGPWRVAIDGVGNVYIDDANNNRVRQVSPAGLITTVA